MPVLLRIVLRSAWHRRLTLGVTLVAIALSVTLLLAIERIRYDARESFRQSVSGTDLVVGARTGPIQLMLYAVFRIGEATNNMTWQSFNMLANDPAVAWAIPLSLGDSHRGFSVLGTNTDYFQHFRYGLSQSLVLKQGRAFGGDIDSVFEAVIGAEVAQNLDYQLGALIKLSHGIGSVNLSEHGDKPFRIVGILAPTGTPVDRTVHVSLQAIEAIHLDWQGGAQLPGFNIPADAVRKFDLAPKNFTAMLVGLKNRSMVFKVQRRVNDYSQEPLMAVLPGVALDQLWRVIGVVEKTLLAVSAMVVLVGVSGLVAVMLAGLNERRRELAVLRSVGAKPRDILCLLMFEGLMVMLSGIFLGAFLLNLAIFLCSPVLLMQFGIDVQLRIFTQQELLLLLLVMLMGVFASLVPGYRAYQLSLADGLSPCS
jgi:putative ABC transport system permease protein